MKNIYSFLILALISVHMYAFENGSSLIDQANEAYQTGDYNSALQKYEQLLNEGYNSADLYYNLGNTYFRLNQPGSAILYFEKAALLEPGDKDIIHNLEVVKKTLPDQLDVISDFFVLEWWDETRNICSPTQWAVIGLLLLWAGIGGLVLWFRGKNRQARKQGFVAGIVLLLLSILPFALGFSAAQYQKDSQKAVIMVEQVNLKSAPDEVSEDLMELHEGTCLQILDEIGEWKKIRLSNGEEGWLETKVLEKI